MNAQHCRSCGKPIVFLPTKAKAMPVDAETVAEGDAQYDAKRHRSHFATCPAAAKYRGGGAR